MLGSLLTRTLTLLALGSVAAGLECPLQPKNESCSDQMPHLNLSSEDCVVEYYLRNASECAAMPLAGDGSSRRLGSVRLRPYQYEGNVVVTALNVSLLDVRWTRLVLRFSSLGGRDPPTNFCRGFRLSARALSLTAEQPARLFYDCMWCNCDEQSFSLEYSASDAAGRHAEYGRFLFTVPHHNYLDQPFPYMEASSPLTAVVRWPAPASPGVNYSVAKLVDGRQTESHTLPASQQCLKLPLGGVPRGSSLSASVREQRPGCSRCPAVSTPPLLLEWNPFVLYMWAAAGVVALASAILLTVRLVWRRMSEQRLASKQARGPPRVLLVYRHASDGHVALVRQLAAFLGNHGGCSVLLDEEDIPRCSEPDPLAWYSEMMVSADVVLVVASPPATPLAAPATAGVYAGAVGAAESLLGARLSRGGRCEALSLPGRPQLPPPARGLRLLAASRPSHLLRLLRRLHAGGGRGPAAAAAARALLKVAREAELCPQQAPPAAPADAASHLPAVCSPPLSSESPEPPPRRRASVSRLFDLQGMSLLGPESSGEDTEDAEGGEQPLEVGVSLWTADGAVSLQL